MDLDGLTEAIRQELWRLETFNGEMREAQTVEISALVARQEALKRSLYLHERVAAMLEEEHQELTDLITQCQARCSPLLDAECKRRQAIYECAWNGFTEMHTALSERCDDLSRDILRLMASIG